MRYESSPHFSHPVPIADREALAPQGVQKLAPDWVSTLRNVGVLAAVGAGIASAAQGCAPDRGWSAVEAEYGDAADVCEGLRDVVRERVNRLNSVVGSNAGSVTEIKAMTAEVQACLTEHGISAAEASRLGIRVGDDGWTRTIAYVLHDEPVATLKDLEE